MFGRGGRDTPTSGPRVYGDGGDQVDIWCKPCRAAHGGIPLCRGGGGGMDDRVIGSMEAEQSEACRRSTGLVEVTDNKVMATMAAVINVDRVLFGPVGVWGCQRSRGWEVGSAIGGCKAVQPGNTALWLPRWRFVRRPCALATKVSRGGGGGVGDGGQTRVGKQDVWGRSTATTGQKDELLQVLVHIVVSAPPPRYNDAGKGVCSCSGL